MPVFPNPCLDFQPIGLKNPIHPSIELHLENFLVKDGRIFVSSVNPCAPIAFERYTAPPLFEPVGMRNRVLNRANENL